MNKIVLRTILAVIVMAGLFALWSFLLSIKPVDPSSPAGQAELSKIADDSKPIADALATYRRQHRRYPSTLIELRPHLDDTSASAISGNRWGRWTYYHYAIPGSSEPGECSISTAVRGHDDLMKLDCTQAGCTWEYDLGDGTPPTRLHFLTH